MAAGTLSGPRFVWAPYPLAGSTAQYVVSLVTPGSDSVAYAICTNTSYANVVTNALNATL